MSSGMVRLWKVQVCKLDAVLAVVWLQPQLAINPPKILIILHCLGEAKVGLF